MTKDKNHLYYFIDKEVFYEAYQTIRGIRYRKICDCALMPDCDPCPVEVISVIKREYYKP